MPAPIFLTGMMASGKSTVGKILAREHGAVFVDLDDRIARIHGRTIPALLAEGEPPFRARERAALAALVAEPGFAGRAVVVATGGGVVVDPDNRRAMTACGIVVHLDVPPDELARRLRASAPDPAALRPLLADAGRGLRARLAEILTARRQAYRDAHVVVDGRDTPEVVAARVHAAVVKLAGARDSEAV
jgi:shikimate kinase